MKLSALALALPHHVHFKQLITFYNVTKLSCSCIEISSCN